MSLIAEYRATEEAIKELQGRLQKLQGNDRLQREIEFEEKLRKLMGEYNKKFSDVVSILDPQAGGSKKAPVQSKGQRRERSLKRYTNPNTNEVVETKGGNNKILKEWKQQYGAEVVEGWAAIVG